MQAWLDCLHVSSEFLIDSLIGLGDYLVGIIDKAAAKAGNPCSHAAAAFTPAVHTFTIKWNLSMIVIHLWQSYMLWLAV
jgi:hypothetical protein